MALGAAWSAVEGAMASSRGSLPVVAARVDAAVATTVPPAKSAGTSTTYTTKVQRMSASGMSGWSWYVLEHQ